MVVIFVIWHSIAVYGVTMLSTYRWRTIIWNALYSIPGSVGVSAGAHRLWTHHTYKAKWPMRLGLMIGFASVVPYSIYAWVRDHRTHHKFSDTESDPHNARRGFFYSHIGWQVMRKSEAVRLAGRTVDMSDVESDWVVRLQRRHSLQMGIFLILVLPVLVPVLFWHESLLIAFVYTAVRHCFMLNGVWAINSWTHLYGCRPYDAGILPVDNAWVDRIWMGGEAYHNFHHAFPSDYRASELSGTRWNTGTMLIDACAFLGLAYDLKTTTPQVVADRIKRSGRKMR